MGGMTEREPVAEYPDHFVSKFTVEWVAATIIWSGDWTRPWRGYTFGDAMRRWYLPVLIREVYERPSPLLRRDR